MKILMPLMLCACLLAGSASATTPGSEDPKHVTSHQFEALALPFLPNQGQVDPRVEFYAPLFTGTVFVTRDGEIVYSLPAKSTGKDAMPAMGDHPSEGGWVLTERLMTSSTLAPKVQGAGGARVNYFVGRDPHHWQHALPTYDRVSLGEAWPGIEVSLAAHADHVETLYDLAAGADVKRIRLKISGAKALKIKDGQLLAETGLGPVTFEEPRAWQEIGGARRPVAVHYQLHGKDYGFTLGSHDHTAPVVIDPAIQATYLGGSGNSNDIDSVFAMSLAPNGDIYVAGQTNASDFPGTTGGAQATRPTGALATAFVARLDPTLSTLKQATYLGGTKQLDDYALAMAIDAGGDVYIAGFTACTDFPVTTGAAQTSYGGDLGDGFVAKFSADLKTLDQATYLGGSGDELTYGIAIGSGGDIYVAGYTGSSDFPGTSGGAQAVSGGSGDAFVAKLDSGLTTVEQSSYVGGSSTDSARAIALGPAGEVYVTGLTDSSDLPGTGGGAQPATGASTAGNSNAFVAKFDPTLATLLQATYLGGGSATLSPGVWSDFATAIAIGPSGDVYITGLTVSPDFPGTAGGAQEQLDGGQDAFVAKFNADLTTLDQATYLGGSSIEFGNALGFDSSGDVLVGGYTYSYDLPGTAGGAQPVRLGASADGFVSRLTPDLRTLDQATYVGGGSGDFIAALSVDSSGDVYVAGQTGSRDFPGAAGGAQASFGSANVTGFIAKLPPDLKAQVSVKVYFFNPGFPGVNLTSLAPGGFDDINVSVTNTSTDSDATGIDFTVTLPPNLVFQEALPEFGSCGAAGQVVTCYAPNVDLTPGLGFSTQIIVQAGGSGSGNVVAEITHVDQDVAAGSTMSAQLGVAIDDDDTAAEAGSVNTHADQAVRGQLSASNPCGCGTPAYKIDTAPTHGNVNITNTTTGAFTYIPTTGYAGSDSFIFELDNGIGKGYGVATETVTVTDIAPKAHDAQIRVVARRTFRDNLKGITAYKGQVLSYSMVGAPLHGTVTITNPGTGAYTYTASSGFTGTDSFTFQVTDQWGTASNVATVSITVR